MVKQRGLFLFLGLLFIIPQTLFAAQDGGMPGYFLSLGTGARALSLGQAFVAVADDVSAIYFNPAGIGQLEKRELSFMHVTLFEDTRYDALSFAYPMDRLGFGVGVIQLTSTGFERRDENNIPIPGNLKDENRALLLSTSLKVSKTLFLGGSCKIINKILDDINSIDFGFDLSLLYKPVNHLRLGVNLQNLIPPRIKRKDMDDVFPLNIKLGLAYNPYNNFVLSLEIDKIRNYPSKVYAGTEYWILKERFALRGGVSKGKFKERTDFESVNFTPGIGIRLKNFQVDYTTLYQDLGISHRVSLSMRF